jgi:hypothetical protein
VERKISLVNYIKILNSAKHFQHIAAIIALSIFGTILSRCVFISGGEWEGVAGKYSSSTVYVYKLTPFSQNSDGNSKFRPEF